MIGDLDHFKRINDEFSHELGDQVLQIVARIIHKSTRNSDVTARYGGEEFVILFPQTAMAQAYVCCEKLRKAIQEYPWEELHEGLSVTMSIGITDDLSCGNVDKMVSRADERLYLAKGAGRNTVMSDKAA